MDKKTELELADLLAGFYADPLGHVMASYPWNNDRSIQLVKLDRKYRRRYDCEYGPDLWQCQYLDDLGMEIRKRGFDGRKAVEPILFETVSGHGIGKTSLVAWLIKFILDTRPFSKGIVTAMTVEQLKTKTWAELGKWHRMSLTSHWFRYSAGRGSMMISHVDYPQEWRCDAQTCREENSEAFAGLHAANSTPFYIFDEASGIPDKIFEVREGGTTDGEPMVFDFGNPTRNVGRFFENCEGKFKHRHKVRRIDSRDVSITNKPRIRQWLEDYGQDNDFFKVRVRGVFPSASSHQFISAESVRTAQTRELVPDKYAPLVLGVDVARYGDNNSVIWPRRGRDARSFKPRRFHGIDTVDLTSRVIETVRDFKQLGMKVGAIFVDGGGIGGAVVDQLRHLGYDVIDVQFGGTALDSKEYRYIVDELWGRVKNGLREGLCLPEENTPEGEAIKRQLTQRDYYHTMKGQVTLVSKDQMREDGIESPDDADALVLTYAQEVSPLKVPAGEESQGKMAIYEYDPLDSKW